MEPRRAQTKVSEQSHSLLEVLLILIHHVVVVVNKGGQEVGLAIEINRLYNVDHSLFHRPCTYIQEDNGN